MSRPVVESTVISVALTWGCYFAIASLVGDRYSENLASVIFAGITSGYLLAWKRVDSVWGSVIVGGIACACGLIIPLWVWNSTAIVDSLSFERNVNQSVLAVLFSIALARLSQMLLSRSRRSDA